jgi:hypothetical protein
LEENKMAFVKNTVSEFHFSSTLAAGGVAVVSPHGTAAAGKVKKVRITDLKITCGGTPRSVTIGSDSGNYKNINFTMPANSFVDFNWQLPYPMDVVSSTGAVNMIYASASGAGVDIVLDGYVERNE